VVQSLAEEFDVLDIAAAGVKLAHATLGRPDDTQELDSAPPMVERGKEKASAPRFRRPDRDGGDTVRLFIGAGREAGIRPADLVGAIANEARVNSSELGAIEIRDRFSLVEVPAAAAAQILKAMRRTTLRGQKVQVRQDRDDL